MRKKQSIAGAVTCLVMASSIANAADLGGAPVYPRERYEPIQPLVYNWTGFYAGANIGGAWGNGTLSDSAGASWSTENGGVAGGLQLGYNYQMGNVVIGGEWNIDWTSIGTTGPGVAVAGTVLQGSANTNWVTTVAGRLGYAADNWLFYGKGGWAWVNNSATLTDLNTGNSVGVSNTNNGWMAGGGLEYALSRNWTARVDYEFIGLDTITGPGILVNDQFSASRDVQMVTFGVNYRF
jgi:outer membrane immunogenic protein